MFPGAYSISAAVDDDRPLDGNRQVLVVSIRLLCAGVVGRGDVLDYDGVKEDYLQQQLQQQLVMGSRPK